MTFGMKDEKFYFILTRLQNSVRDEQSESGYRFQSVYSLCTKVKLCTKFKKKIPKQIGFKFVFNILYVYFLAMHIIL